MEKCGRSGRVLIDREAIASERYICSHCGRAYSTYKMVNGHLAVCHVYLLDSMADDEQIIKTRRGSYVVTRQPSSVGLALGGIDHVDGVKE